MQMGRHAGKTGSGEKGVAVDWDTRINLNFLGVHVINQRDKLISRLACGNAQGEFSIRDIGLVAWNKGSLSADGLWMVEPSQVMEIVEYTRVHNRLVLKIKE